MTFFRIIDPLKPRSLPDPVYVTATLAERMPAAVKPRFRHGIQGMLERKRLGVKKSRRSVSKDRDKEVLRTILTENPDLMN